MDSEPSEVTAGVMVSCGVCLVVFWIPLLWLVLR